MTSIFLIFNNIFKLLIVSLVKSMFKMMKLSQMPNNFSLKELVILNNNKTTDINCINSKQFNLNFRLVC